MGVSMPLFGGQPVPLGRRCIVLHDVGTAIIDGTKVKLSIGIALLCKPGQLGKFNIVLCQGNNLPFVLLRS